MIGDLMGDCVFGCVCVGGGLWKGMFLMIQYMLHRWLKRWWGVAVSERMKGALPALK